jgi:zinc transporter ZupT
MIESIYEWFIGIEKYWQVLIYASLTAVATGLGVLPFFFFRKITRSLTAYGDSIAAGLMLTASYKLVEEGLEYSLWRVLVGVLIGLILIYFSRQALADKDQFSIGNLKGVSAFKAIMIVGVMIIHSFAEGIGVGVSFGESDNFGIFISAAIAIHNIPEGLAIGLVLITRGISVGKSMLWAIISSIPQPLLAVPSFLFVESFKPFLPIGLGLAAGAMLWMVVSELLFDAFENLNKERVAVAVVIGIIIMIFLQEIIQ